MVSRETSEGSSPLARGLLENGQAKNQNKWIIPARAGFTARPPRRRRRFPDHPRSRGVYAAQVSSVGLIVGSSPLARGLQLPVGEEQRHVRIIPARVGFTARELAHVRDHEDHPRSRGVYRSGFRRPAEAGGSSPLARGLPAGPGWRVRSTGIIPARAGFTRPRRRTGRHRQDHPRSRGVYLRRPGSGSRSSGSSPLARGLRHKAFTDLGISRIIPARAGFTSPRAPGAGTRRDHPRSRGVYGGEGSGGDAVGGSSPLARGLQRDVVGEALPARIIPARAGFTSWACPGPCRPRDHPRSRGVYVNGYEDCTVEVGSSPLARGLQIQTAKTGGRVRIIPARAGFTAPGTPASRRRSDHPRSRGVYHDPLPGWACEAGSSPLARGLP